MASQIGVDFSTFSWCSCVSFVVKGLALELIAICQLLFAFFKDHAHFGAAVL
jgi:hypothetical protein